MSVFSKWMYDLVYRFSRPRWDSDQVPPEVVAFAGLLPAQTRILDLGCGTGTSAVYLAGKGFAVTGVDFSQKALDIASEKAATANVPVRFLASDVTRLEKLADPFDLVLDIGCLHALSPAGRQNYAKEVLRLTKPEARLLIWAIDGTIAGIGVQPEELSKLFAPRFVLKRREVSGLHGRPSHWYEFRDESRRPF